MDNSLQDRLNSLGSYNLRFGITKEVIEVTKPATPVSPEETEITGFRVAIELEQFDPDAQREVAKSRLKFITLAAEGKTLEEAQDNALSKSLTLMGV